MFANLRALLLGIPDGWAQPYSISSSANVDHLGGTNAVYNWQDRGINLGQLARAGVRSEAFTLRYWPLSLIPGITPKDNA